MTASEDAFAPDSLAEVALAARVMLPDGQRFRWPAGSTGSWCARDDVLIVDYKTNRPPPRTLEEIDPAYVRQLASTGWRSRRSIRTRPCAPPSCGPKPCELMEVPAATMERRVTSFSGTPRSVVAEPVHGSVEPGRRP